MGIDLSGAIAAESGNNTQSTTDDTSEDEIPFEANESTEGYALFGDSASLVEAISINIFGNDPVYSLIDWGMDLNDYEEIVKENNLNGQQKLDLLHKLAKSTFGGRQSELNEGYGMGWDTDQSPPKVYDNDKVNHVPYLDVFSHLPAFDHDTLDQGEIDQLENPDIEGAEALDMDDFGFDRSIEGPQLPVINGERVPIIFQNGDEVKKMLEMLGSINFDEVTYCEKNGTLQGTPTLGPSEEEDTDKEAESSKSDGDVDLASNPEQVSEATVNEVKKQATAISSRRTLQQILSKEKAGQNRDTAVERLEQRLRAVKGKTDEDDEEDSSSASQAEVAESVESAEDEDDVEELSDADKNLMSALLQNQNNNINTREEAREEVMSL